MTDYPSGRALGGIPTSARKPLRVLVVDDDDNFRKSAILRLQKLYGADVHEAGGGEAALAKVSETDFDVIFMDISMPGMNGFEVFAALRLARKQARVVFTSADDYPEYREKARALGAPFLSKRWPKPDLDKLLARSGGAIA